MTDVAGSETQYVVVTLLCRRMKPGEDVESIGEKAIYDSMCDQVVVRCEPDEMWDFVRKPFAYRNKARADAGLKRVYAKKRANRL